FDVRDGHGLRLLNLYGGVKLAALTGRRADLVEQRCRELSIDRVVGSSRAKGKAIEQIAADLGVPLEQTAYMGDDVNDLRALRVVPLGLGAALGWLAWYLVPRQRRLAREHLRIAFPEEDEAERDRIGRASFANLGRAAVETARAQRLDIRTTVDLDPPGEALLREAHAEGKGVVVATAHIGAWELFARRVAALGIPCGTGATEAHDPRITALLERIREQGGVRLF